MIPNFLSNRFQLWDAEIHVVLGEEMNPPSVNKMYTAGKFGNLQLKTDGRKYLNKLRFELGGQLMNDQPGPWLYHFFCIVCAPEITNRNFVQEARRALKMKRPMKTTSRVKNRSTGEYEIKPAFTSLIKDKDADGPLKKVQDVFFEVLGMKDSLAITSTGARVRSEEPSVHLLLIPLTREEVLSQTNVTEEVLELWLQR